MSFKERYDAIVERKRSLLCVGLDSDYERIPECLKGERNPIMKFNEEIINATKEYVCAYKPNAAFYESAGQMGFDAYNAIKSQVGENIPIIADVKRGDIGNTARHYAKSVFDELNFDAATVNPYMGFDAIEPFIMYKGKYVFALALTSNKSATDFEYYHNLYKEVAKKIVEWNKQYDNSIGLVVGATKPEELGEIRDICKDEIFLIPGIGSQGGDVEKVIKNGFGGKYGNMIVNVSRSIIFASNGKDFAEKAAEKAAYYRDLINSFI